MILNAKIDALCSALNAALPGRSVTRSWVDPQTRSNDELRHGVLTVVIQSGGDYTHCFGREAHMGRAEMLWVANFYTGDKGTGQDVEQAELALVAEVETFLRALPEDLAGIELKGWNQSGQLEAPYGWVVFRLSWEFY